MNYIYRLNETTITDENGEKYTVYGIDAVNDNGYILESHTDIFFDRLKAEEFVSLCNECELELIHLPDVVEDAITEQYAVFCWLHTVFLCSKSFINRQGSG